MSRKVTAENVSKAGVTGIEHSLRSLAVSIVEGSRSPAIVKKATEFGTVHETITFVRERHTWVPDPTDNEYILSPDLMLERDGLDGNELCVLLGSLLVAEGFETRVSVRQYDGFGFVHPVLHWKDARGAWHLVDPCSSDYEKQNEHDRKMVAEMTVPVPRG